MWNPSGGVDMVVLKHRPVGKIKPVIFTASHRDGVFLQRPQTRQGFPGISDGRPGTRHQLHRLMSGGGYPGHMLQQIQRRPLPFEQQTGFSL